MNSSAENVGRIGIGRHARLCHRLLDRMLGRPHHHGAQAEGEGEQVAQRDRPSGRHGVVDRRFRGSSARAGWRARAAVRRPDRRGGACTARPGSSPPPPSSAWSWRRCGRSCRAASARRLPATGGPAPRHGSRRDGSPGRRYPARRPATHGPPAHRAGAPIASWTTQRCHPPQFSGRVVVKRSRQRAQPPSWTERASSVGRPLWRSVSTRAPTAIDEGHRHQRLAIDDACRLRWNR